MHPQGHPLSRQIDLNLLELFDVTFRTRNLTATGARLGLSQPAVSYGLAKLRRMYSDALFVRMQRGVQPTPTAMRLAAPIAAAMEIVRGTIKKVEFVPTEFPPHFSHSDDRYGRALLSSAFGASANR